MKRHITFHLFLVLPFYLFSQEANSSIYKNEENIYYQALKKYIEYTKNTNSCYIDTLYIDCQNSITDSLKTELDGIKIIVLNSEGIAEHFKIKKSLLLIRIYPLQFYNKEFSIFITPYSVEKKRGEIQIPIRRRL